jgi:hypothetical protein
MRGYRLTERDSRPLILFLGSSRTLDGFVYFENMVPTEEVFKRLEKLELRRWLSSVKIGSNRED